MWNCVYTRKCCLTFFSECHFGPHSITVGGGNAAFRFLVTVNKRRRRRRVETVVSGSGLTVSFTSGKMLTRISRFGLTLPRLLYNPPARLVSQSKANSATGSTAVTELHPEVQHSGHGEVSPYVKVSSARSDLRTSC